MLTNAIVVFMLIGQAPADAQRARDEGAERLEFMKGSVKIYAFFQGTRQSPLRLQTEPAFRLGSQGNGVLEGAIFLWNDDIGRPEAAAQVFLHKQGNPPIGVWLHEFTSLSPETITADQGGLSRWSPQTPGVQFRTIPDAPKPAATPVQRMRQMRALAQDFRAKDDFGERGWIDLRMLPTPVARYGKRDGFVLDGALFAFVVGTDPEVFLFVEARPGPDGPEWQYALAPMTCWPVKASRNGQTVWELPRRFTDDSSKPFFCRTYVP